MNTTQKKSRTIIIIASGFEEESTVICLKRFRSAGLNVKLVGLTARPVIGAHGLVVRPDCSLEELDGDRVLELMIVPGNEKSAEVLLADPRFHRLFRVTVANLGHIGIMRSAETAFGRAGLTEILSTPRCLRQGNMDVNTFSRKLAAAM
jgi:putative intracellular protease/amidase